MKGHSSGGDLPESQCWLVALVGQPSVLESGPNRPKMDKIRQLPDRARPVPLLCSLISSPWFPSKAKLMFHRLTEKVFVLKKKQNDDFLKIVKSEVDSNEEISPGKGLSPCLHAVKDQFAKSQREEGESSLAFTRGADRRGPSALHTEIMRVRTPRKSRLPDLPPGAAAYASLPGTSVSSRGLRDPLRCTVTSHV